MQWLEDGVFTSNMSILVNGSPTKEFSIKRGLRQGDPLSLHLFSIAVEGLAGIVKHATNTSTLKGFEVNDMISYSLLQYADDTILVG